MCKQIIQMKDTTKKEISKTKYGQVTIAEIIDELKTQVWPLEQEKIVLIVKIRHGRRRRKIRHIKKTRMSLITFPQPQVMQAYVHTDYGTFGSEDHLEVKLIKHYLIICFYLKTGLPYSMM